MSTGDIKMEYDETCYLCDEDFKYKPEDTSITSDIIEGQYTEFEIAQCPHCEMWIKV